MFKLVLLVLVGWQFTTENIYLGVKVLHLSLECFEGVIESLGLLNDSAVAHYLLDLTVLRE